MMKQRKRIASAWFLLSVFVSMTILSGLHHHQPTVDTATDCADCVHHIHHSGHFTTAAEHFDDCVLCNFLSLTYTPAVTLQVTVPTCLTILSIHGNIDFTCCDASLYKPTRAPPFIL